MTEINHPLLTPLIADKIASKLPFEACASAMLVCRPWRDSVEHVCANPYRDHKELSFALRAPAHAKRVAPPDDPHLRFVDKIATDATAGHVLVTDRRPVSWGSTCAEAGAYRAYLTPVPAFDVLCQTINRTGTLAAFGLIRRGIMLALLGPHMGQTMHLCARPSHPTALAFSGDGLRLAVGGFEMDHALGERITVWDTQSYQCLRTINQLETGQPFSMALDWVGAVLAVGARGRVTLWDLEAIDGPASFPAPEPMAYGEPGYATRVAVSDDGRRVGMAVDSNLYAYSRTSADQWTLSTVATTASRIGNFSMSASGAVMASSSQTGSVTLWNATDAPGFAPRIFRESNRLRIAHALAPDARRLAVSQNDGSLKIYHMAGEQGFVGSITAGLSRWWATPAFFSSVL